MSASSQKEREELRVTLRSGIFAKAPRQAKLLEYICNEYLEGRSEQIKEYNLATEVLGRTVDFDQNRDAIVRVEVHRLRHKLKEYYEGEGAGHTLRIVIDPGHYVPRFVPQEETPSIEPHGDSGSPPSTRAEDRALCPDRRCNSDRAQTGRSFPYLAYCFGRACTYRGSGSYLSEVVETPGA